MGKGEFQGNVKVEWLDGGRDMRLLEEVIYIDQFGKRWRAVKGAVINGASIPRFMWRVIGSPFVGLYRRASVIHDCYCVNHLRGYEDTHKCFEEMMLTDGVGKIKRFLMAQAVKKFGPRW